MEAATVARRSAAAPARAPRTRPKPAAVPRSRPRPARAPRSLPIPSLRPAGQLIPIAVGTASAVRRLPDSTLVVRMTQGRVWIGVLGVLLAGIVALNVFTLSLAADAGHVAQNIEALEQENGILRARDDHRSSVARVQSDAAEIGLVVPQVNRIESIEVDHGDVATAVARLAAAGSGY